MTNRANGTYPAIYTCSHCNQFGVNSCPQHSPLRFQTPPPVPAAYFGQPMYATSPAVELAVIAAWAAIEEYYRKLIAALDVEPLDDNPPDTQPAQPEVSEPAGQARTSVPSTQPANAQVDG